MPLLGNPFVIIFLACLVHDYGGGKKSIGLAWFSQRKRSVKASPCDTRPERQLI